MIGGQHVDHVIGHGFQDRLSVGLCFDRRVAFDQRAETIIVVFGKEQVMNTGLGRDVLVSHRPGCKQRQFFGGGDMQDMQTRGVARGQIHGFLRGGDTGLARADHRMLAYRDVFAVGRARLVCVGLDHGRVLTVGEDRQWRMLEDGLKGGVVIHQHLAGGSAHEDLHAGRARAVPAFDGLDVVVGSAQMKAVIGRTPPACHVQFGHQRFVVDGGRLDVGHVHEAGNAAGHRGA